MIGMPCGLTWIRTVFSKVVLEQTERPGMRFLIRMVVVLLMLMRIGHPGMLHSQVVRSTFLRLDILNLVPVQK